MNKYLILSMLFFLCSVHLHKVTFSVYKSMVQYLLGTGWLFCFQILKDLIKETFEVKNVKSK